MAPSRRKGASKAAAAAAARRQWKVGDLVLAKVKGFPSWPATVSDPEKWGYTSDWKKVFVYFFGTKQIAFCNPVDVEAFTEEKKKSLLTKRHGKGADFVRAVQEIIDSFDKWKKQDQVDNCNCCDDFTLTNSGDSVDLSSKFQSKDIGENSEATQELQLKALTSSVDRNESVLKDSNEMLVNALHGKEEATEEPTADVIVKEVPSISTYYSRKRSKGSSAKTSVTQRTEAPVKNSRCSSRLESSRLQNFVKPSNCIGRSSEDIATKSDLGGCVRRSRRIRKSTDTYSKCDDLHGLSNGSIGDDRSEIANAESDSLSLNEGSSMDTGCNIEQSDNLQCSRGELESSNKHHLQIKTVAVKKKRQLKAKRVTNDAAEVGSKFVKAAKVEVELNETNNVPNTCDKVTERYFDKDEDEYLPLLKRARVRMGKFSMDDLPKSMQIEEKTTEEDGKTLLGKNKSSLNCDENRLADGYSFVAKRDMEDASKSCTVSAKTGAQLWPVTENQSLGCPLDEEASLPPSKRIHRALEAMSANAAEGQHANTSTMNTLMKEHCASSMEQSPDLPTRSDEGNRSGLKGDASPGISVPVVGVFEFSINPSGIVSEETHKSSMGLAIGTQLVNAAGSQIIKTHEDTFVEEMKPRNCKDINEPSSGTCNFQVAFHNLGHASPYLDKVTEVMPSRDEVSIENNVLSDVGCENTDKEANGSRHFVMGSSPVSGTDKPLQHFLESETEHIVPKSHTDEVSQLNRMSDTVDGIKENERQKDTNPIEYSGDHFDDKDTACICSSSSPTARVDSPGQVSAPNSSVSVQKTTVFYTPTLESATHEDGRVELAVTEGSKCLGKSSNSEAKVALSSFEAMLGTLTRTKESIGRATRIAIDCAKFGTAAKVIEILMRNLETELNLHRRVDLFFLVDSITQCSRGLKGHVGGIYPSAIQAVLPRLLSAAAPPGSTAQENRRQCLKVLRLWSERRILPESVIRSHIRELDSLGDCSAGLYSRRSLRTERALDDPVREMEGMLVDEYGSNSCFQLPGFCMPSMLKDEDGDCDSDGGSFEAVTPERNSEAHEEHEKTPVTEKHRHILEDVDVELEMEDVAPCSGAEANHSYNATQLNSLEGSQNQIEQNFPHLFAHQQPPEVAASLPLAPLPSECPVHPPPVPCSGSASEIPDRETDGADLKVASDHGMQGSFGQSVTQQEASRCNPSFSISGYNHSSGYRGTQLQTQPAESSSRPFRTFHGPARNNVQKGATYCKSHLSRPPHVPSNNCSYIQLDQRVKSWREAPSHCYSNRYHNGHMDRVNYYNNHERMKPAPHDYGGGWRRSMPPFSGQRYPDKKVAYEPNPYMVPTCESTRLPGWGLRDTTRLPGWASRESTRLPGWGSRPHSSNRRSSTSFRSPPESVVLVSDRAPSFWQPR